MSTWTITYSEVVVARVEADTYERALGAAFSVCPLGTCPVCKKMVVKRGNRTLIHFIKEDTGDPSFAPGATYTTESQAIDAKGGESAGVAPTATQGSDGDVTTRKPR